MRARLRNSVIAAALLATLLPLSGADHVAIAVPNPVATNEGTYQAFGRVFPDPHGCLAYGVPDGNGDGRKDTPRGISPWAKGRVCAGQYLQYQEVIEGAKFLERRFPSYLDVIRLDQAYDNPNYMSAGLPRDVVIEDGKPKVLGRDRRPLYMFKLTDSTSTVPEADRQHYAYVLSIHGIERAGVEGGVRAMEDLMTWAACEDPAYNAPALPGLPPPACAVEGPFPRPIVETPTDKPVPTASEVLDNAVIYFVLANPDGWARGQVAPVEVEDGSPNVNYAPGFFFQRYNGNGVDLNRDWPTIGYSYKPYSPGSEPEVKAFGEVLKGIAQSTTAGRFAGGIDLHGMLTADAFSYTLIGAGQRDYRKNTLTVDTAVRTWQDQTQRMSWSPYVADANANGQKDSNETCAAVPSLGGNAPACVADEWGTVIDTIGYQITGGFGDWIDSPLGLDGVGIDNEMYASHLAPNTVFEPALAQTHIDGNKGLIFSQLAAMGTSGATTFEPTGSVGYVFDPTRVEVVEGPRPGNPGLPAQDDIDATLPCHSAPAGQDVDGNCSGGTFNPGAAPSFEFDVHGPAEGIWNGGLTLSYTGANVAGAGATTNGSMQLQMFDEGQWHSLAYHYRQGYTQPGAFGQSVPVGDVYLPTGQVVTLDDPKPGRYRVYFERATALPGRVRVDFRHATAEDNPGQVRVDASSMDFFDELNRYVPDGSDLARVGIDALLADPASLDRFDSLVLVNNLGSREHLVDRLGLSHDEATAYFEALRGYAERGGNLVLTDAALQALPEFGVVFDVRRLEASSETHAGNFAFEVGTNNVTYTDPERYPLATDVNVPGAAEQELGRRQAVEPAPLGYSPDYGLDPDPKLPNWAVDKSEWNSVCGIEDCVTAATTSKGSNVNLGEALIGDGRIRIAGIMFPDPVYDPDEANDHRFGISDYALTYTGWQVFENLIDYQRP